MRLKGLNKFFSFSRYRKLQQDFKTPVLALRAAAGISGSTITLQTRSGETMQVDRGDLPLWEAYFKPRGCEVRVEQGMFHVLPINGSHPDYFIKGCSGGVTWNPGRWSKAADQDGFITWLQAREKSVCSQHGEDGVLEALMEKLPCPTNFIVEFGAYDGICMSNSRYFVDEKKWSALLIEADPRFYKKLSALYKGHPSVSTLKSFVTTENINALFTGAGVPKDFDILSIDIDSIDYYVWEALTEFTPRIVVVEYNASIAPDREYVVPEDKAIEYSGTSREGASILSLYMLGKRKGYRLLYAELSGANLFFLHESVVGYFEASGFRPEEVYQPPQFGVVCGGDAPNGRGYPAEGG
jgi:hypothetical protein